MRRKGSDEQIFPETVFENAGRRGWREVATSTLPRSNALRAREFAEIFSRLYFIVRIGSGIH